MRDQALVLDEWFFTISVPAKGRRGRITVAVKNAEARDRAFALALARLIEVWVNARRSR